MKFWTIALSLCLSWTAFSADQQPQPEDIFLTTGKFAGENADTWLWGSCSLEISSVEESGQTELLIQDNDFINPSQYRIPLHSSTRFKTGEKLVVRGTLNLVGSEYVGGPQGAIGDGFNLEIFFDSETKPVRFRMIHSSVKELENEINCSDLKAY